MHSPSQDSCGPAGGTLALLTQFLSPEQPAIHNLALQAGSVYLQPVPEQREPQPGGCCHPHHHEPESHRSVACEDVRDAVGRAWLCLDCCSKGTYPGHAELADFFFKLLGPSPPLAYSTCPSYSYLLLYGATEAQNIEYTHNDLFFITGSPMRCPLRHRATS